MRLPYLEFRVSGSRISVREFVDVADRFTWLNPRFKLERQGDIWAVGSDDPPSRYWNRNKVTYLTLLISLFLAYTCVYK